MSESELFSAVGPGAPGGFPLQPEYVLLPGFQQPKTPAFFNRVGLLTWQAPCAVPETVLILSPGFTAGAGTFRYVAPEIVAQCGGKAAVWAVDRRSNLLDDPSGFLRAAAAADPTVALRYYLGGSGSPGWLPPSQDDVPWMEEWGLEVALGDLRAVVVRAQMLFPAARIVLGGHSLGGMLAQAYAASKFSDGSIGQSDLGGLVLVDGSVRGQGCVAQLRDQGAGSYRRLAAGQRFWEDWSRVLAPQVCILAQCAALAGSTPGWENRPSVIQAAARSFHGPGAALVSALLPHSGAVATNRAVFGLAVDDGSAPSPMARAHVGRPHLDEAAQQIRWIEGPESGEIGDLNIYADLLRDGGDTDGLEWHSPIRLNADLDMVQNLDSSTIPESLAAGGPQFVRHNASVRLPVLALATSDHAGSVEGAEWYRTSISSDSFSLVVAEGYAHMDPLVVPAMNNRFLQALIPWLKGLTG